MDPPGSPKTTRRTAQMKARPPRKTAGSETLHRSLKRPDGGTATFTRRPAAIRGVSARLVGSILLYCAIRAYHPRTSLVQFDNALYDGGLA